MNYKIYPSGFLGSVDIPQTVNLQRGEMNALYNDKTYIPQSPEITASIPATELANLLNSTEFKKLNNLDLLKKVIEVAKLHFDYFGTLANFIDVQTKSGEFGSTHMDWLIETFEYVINGRMRRYGVETWVAILSVNNNIPISRKDSKVLQKYLAANNPTMKDFILQWLSQPKGMKDLIESMYVIFGIR